MESCCPLCPLAVQSALKETWMPPPAIRHILQGAASATTLKHPRQRVGGEVWLWGRSEPFEKDVDQKVAGKGLIARRDWFSLRYRQTIDWQHRNEDKYPEGPPPLSYFPTHPQSLTINKAKKTKTSIPLTTRLVSLLIPPASNMGMACNYPVCPESC